MRLKFVPKAKDGVWTTDLVDSSTNTPAQRYHRHCHPANYVKISVFCCNLLHKVATSFRSMRRKMASGENANARLLLRAQKTTSKRVVKLMMSRMKLNVLRSFTVKKKNAYCPHKNLIHNLNVLAQTHNHNVLALIVMLLLWKWTIVVETHEAIALWAIDSCCIFFIKL